MMKKAVFYVILVLAAACQYISGNDSTDQETDQGTALNLNGQWTWVKTEGAGIAGPFTRTAEQSGDSETINFMQNHKVKIDRNIGGTQSSEIFTYTIHKEANEYIIAYYVNGELVRKEFIEKKGSGLTLSNYEPCCDNTYESYYVK